MWNAFKELRECIEAKIEEMWCMHVDLNYRLDKNQYSNLRKVGDSMEPKNSVQICGIMDCSQLADYGAL